MSFSSYTNGGATKKVKREIGNEHVWPVAVASNYSSIIPEMEHFPAKTRPPDHKKTSKYKYTFIKTRLSTIKFI